MTKPTIQQLTDFLLTQKGFRIDEKGELRYYNYIFWTLDKCIISKKINEYKN